MMKKIVFIILATFLFSQPVNATENYLQYRYKTLGENHERYLLFETYIQDKIVFGSKYIQGGHDFQLIEPYLGYKLDNNFQIGVKYAADSLGGESITPVFRFMTPCFERLFFSLEALYYIDLKDKKDQIDLWAQLSTVGKGWYSASEARFFHRDNDVFIVRPAKFGYRFESGLAPFVMYEKKWSNHDQTDSFYIGLEIKF